jgi:hypothetical protein
MADTAAVRAAAVLIGQEKGDVAARAFLFTPYATVARHLHRQMTPRVKKKEKKGLGLSSVTMGYESKSRATGQQATSGAAQRAPVCAQAH